jgi:hypothetical protein
MYDALIQAQERLRDAIVLVLTEPHRRLAIGKAIFDMEALIVTNCLFTDVLNPVEVLRGPTQFGTLNFQSPGNLAQAVAVPGAGSAIAGIIDTIEHPCCCKLLVDLEFIARVEGI